MKNRGRNKAAIGISYLLCYLLFLTACGQGTDNTNKPAAAAPTNTAPSPSDNTSTVSETVTFHADNGDVQVSKKPQRIVDLTNFYTGFFLALGVKPVGVLSGSAGNPYFEGMLEGVQDLGNEPSPEKILELKPDLIITYTGTEGVDVFEKIAPVVAVEYGKRNYKEQMLEFGKLIGNEEAGKTWVDRWEKKIQELKPKVQEAVGTKTVSILNPYEKGLFVFGHNFGRGGEIIYGEFGLKAPPEAQKAAIDSGTGWASISLEKLPEFSGDIIFTCPWAGDTSDPKIVYDNPIWKKLPAVKNHHVFQLNPKADTYNDPISLEGQLDFITESLLSTK